MVLVMITQMITLMICLDYVGTRTIANVLTVVRLRDLNVNQGTNR